MLLSRFTPVITFIAFLLIALGGPSVTRAQIVVNDNQTAVILANKLVGVNSGITILNPVLSCPGGANGVFTATNSTLNGVSIDSGILLATGWVSSETVGYLGISQPASSFSSAPTGGGSDADLSAAGGGVTTNDKCFLQFELVPIGDTIQFAYLFASEEYPEYSCGGVSDIFGFFIKPFNTPTPFTNIAVLPNTNIPISINTVNPDPTNCGNAAIGADYYFDNSASTTLVYDGYAADITSNPGILQSLIARSAVVPCDTYTLKLAIADVGDSAFDSGVFLKAGSLVSTNIVVSATGGSVITGVDTPLVVRECLTGQFTFEIPIPKLDTFTIKYTITGNATNGVDYGAIPDSVVLLPGETSVSIIIDPVVTMPASADTEYVTLNILSPYVCNSGPPIVVATSTIMILNNLPIDAYASRDTVCPNGDAVLSVTLGQLSCGLSEVGCGSNTPSDFYAGTESNTGFTPTPYGDFAGNGGDRMQFLYSMDELRALGMEPGFINNAGFNIAQKGSIDTFKKFTIKMACTNDPYLGGAEFKTFNNITEVLPPTDVVTSLGWNVYNFPVPYYWDGNTSLLVEICWAKDSVHLTGQPDLVYYTNTPFTSTMYMPGGFVPANNFQDPCNQNDESGANAVNTKRPNTRFSSCAASNYSFDWSPSTFLDNDTLQSPTASGITGNSVTYTVTVRNILFTNCVSTDAVTIGVDNSNSIDATPQNPAVVCAPGYVQLNAAALGLAPLTNLACGTAGTLNCNTPDSVVIGVQPASPSNPSNTPYLSNGSYTEYQFILPRSEMLATGMSSGTLRSLSFLGQGGPALTNPLANYRISLKCTDRTEFPNTASEGDFETGATLVYTGAAQAITPTGWNKFSFQQPYNWDTSKNLVVQICLGPQTTNFPGNNPVSMTFGTAIQKASNFSDVCDNQNSGSAVNAYGQRPIVKFDYCPAPAAPFAYTWTTGTFLSDSSIANPVAYVEQPITYYVSTIGRNGCRVEDSVQLLFPSHDYSLSPVDTSICPGDRVPYQVYGTNIISATWYENGFNTAQNFSCNPCLNPVATPADDIDYQVIINDALNCPDTLFAHVNVYPQPNVNILNSDTIIRYGDQFMLMVNGGTEFTWFPVGSLSDPRLPNPVASPTEPTRYTVIGHDQNGCRNVDSIFVDIDYRDNITVPSAFTPNGDGLNDVFRVTGLTNHRLMEFRVYNRWGREVFYTTDPKSGWDGTYNGARQDMDVYKYLIKVAYPDGYTNIFKGDVTLIR